MFEVRIVIPKTKGTVWNTNNVDNNIKKKKNRIADHFLYELCLGTTGLGDIFCTLVLNKW